MITALNSDHSDMENALDVLIRSLATVKPGKIFTAKSLKFFTNPDMHTPSSRLFNTKYKILKDIYSFDDVSMDVRESRRWASTNVEIACKMEWIGHRQPHYIAKS